MDFSDRVPERWWEKETLSCCLRGFFQLLKHRLSDPKASWSLRLVSVSCNRLLVNLDRCLLANRELLQDTGTSLAWLSLKRSHLAQSFKPFWIVTEKAGEMKNPDVYIRKRYRAFRSVGRGFQV